ncbi:glycosyltransferase family 2 protein [Candidatus Merdisoma sp. JLR.KK011]|uniref:glycosyltransferase family 2 protein n=1 Tax=Candidatus Merdisoma sp. JLR.KK011 TaxID=3114299 RepID=UPI002FEF0173
MISVIVPIYNVKAYLSQCIESLLCQTYTDLEIILVDDGSTDGCADICEEYGKKDSRIVIIHRENGGLVSARKAGVKAARGTYIAYVDGDDWIEPDMYQRMYQKMTEERTDIVMCGHYQDTGAAVKKVLHGIPEGRYGKEELVRDVYPRMLVNESFFEWGIYVGVWDKLYRKECLERYQYEVDERVTIGEDAACIYPCLLNAESIYVMEDCFYHYRQTLSSMVKQIPDRELEREKFRILYETVEKSLEKYAGIFDLRQQWKTYMLFAMLPRTDSLYRGCENLDFLFPFSGVKKGERIVLYCAGLYGQRIYHFLKKTGFCSVAAWVDRNYKELGSMGLPVESPEVIPGVSYDAIVIANTYERSRKALYQELIGKYPKEKVHMPDVELIFSEESMKAFGLTENAG